MRLWVWAEVKVIISFFYGAWAFLTTVMPVCCFEAVLALNPFRSE